MGKSCKFYSIKNIYNNSCPQQKIVNRKFVWILFNKNE